MKPSICITTGEPAGIGPELCEALVGRRLAADITLIGNRALLEARAPRAARRFAIHDLPLGAPVVAGKLNRRNAAYVLATLDTAIAGCLQGRFGAMVTAPIQKSVILDAGIAPNFYGHTEYLQEKARAKHVVMMLAGRARGNAALKNPLRVALATIHHPLAQVPGLITRTSLTSTLRVLHHDLKTRFGLASPRILIAGLNPHAGESGHLGREEIEVIAPVVRKLTREGMRLVGPLPADTLFTPKYLNQTDAVLAMYHDQGLSVLKFATFGLGVNITLGLPFIRTSVDHGTALDLAGKGIADASSLIEAVKLAVELATQR